MELTKEDWARVIYVLEHPIDKNKKEELQKIANKLKKLKKVWEKQQQLQNLSYKVEEC